MAHEIENVNGKDSFMYVGATPWHGLGIKLDKPPTMEEAIVAAGMDWEVKKEPIYLSREMGVTHKVPNTFALTREINGNPEVFGVTGPEYVPLQNREAFKFFQPWLDNGLATLETAGSLRNGKRPFVLAKICKDPLKIVGQDDVERYILLSNSHDGKMAVRIGFTPIRVVCANTLRLAHEDAASKLLSVRHSRLMAGNLETIRDIMNLANSEFEATAEQYRFLASRQVDFLGLEKYVKTVMGISEADQKEGKKGNRVFAEIVNLFEKGRGADLPGVRGTYWGAYNAFNEYLNYGKGEEQDARVDNLWFGQNASLNQKALDTALQLAKVA